jgi:flagellin-like hook-associated protein FlgL
MLYANFNTGLQSNMDAIYNDNAKLASGKKLNKPSDDPAAMYTIINGKAQLQSIEGYQNAISGATLLLNAASTSLSSIGSLIADAKQAGANAKDALPADLEQYSAFLSNYLQSVIGIANTKVGQSYIFSGYKTNQPAVNATTGMYQGTSDRVSTQINSGVNLDVGFAGNEVIAYGAATATSANSGLITPASSDLGLVTDTSSHTLSTDVYSIKGGSLSISLGGGAATSVAIPAGSTLDAVSAAINAAATGVTAQVVNANPTGSPADCRIMLSVSPPSTAAGISVGVTTTDAAGTGLNGIASSAMKSVYSTNGGSLSISLGGAAATAVTIAAGATLADVRDAINASGTGVRAEVVDANLNGSPVDYRLMLSAAPSSTAADISVSVTTTDAAGYGLNRAASAGMTSVVSPDKTVIGAMNILKAAIEMGDKTAMQRAIDNLTEVASTVASQQSELGVRLNRATTEKNFLASRDLDITNVVADKLTMSEVDIARVTIDAQQRQTALSSLRAMTSGFLQTSLFDFIK